MAYSSMNFISADRRGLYGPVNATFFISGYRVFFFSDSPCIFQFRFYLFALIARHLQAVTRKCRSHRGDVSLAFRRPLHGLQLVSHNWYGVIFDACSYSQ